MLKRFINSLLFVFNILLFFPSHAQVTPDSLHKDYITAESNFYKAIGPQSRLYNGKTYDYYSPEIQGNAYFMDVNDWKTGLVSYDSVIYKDVNILYDIYKDELVVQLMNKLSQISLNSEMVQSFDLLGHHFIYVGKDSEGKNSINPGFYDQLYKGQTKVLAKRSKIIEATSGLAQAVSHYFSAHVIYFIYRGGKYYTVSSESSVLSAFKDRKKELQLFISNNNIRFNDNPEQAMVKVAAYYDSLK